MYGMLRWPEIMRKGRQTSRQSTRSGSRKYYLGGYGPSSFGRQQRAELLCPIVQH